MIRTVLGDVDPADLGVTFAHEHLLMTGDWPVMDEPDFRLDSVDSAVEEIAPARAAGLSAVVEMTPLGFGRSPRGLAEISRRTGVHVVAVTGFHKVGYYSDRHWLHRYSAEQIAGLLAAEIEQGMDEHGLVGPLLDRTAARAGAVKIGTGYHRFGRSVGKLIEAAGIVHARTGVPVTTHTDQGTGGHELLDALARAGVPGEKVVLGHIDHNPDPGYLAELAARGAWLAFDMPGRVKYAPDSQSVTLIAALHERGHSGRLLLGSDLARRSYWRSLGGGPGLDYLLTRFVPRLTAAGLGEVVKRALVTNPARAFSLGAGEER
ncbi:phosphotriesterase-related protein [Amycolatopsis deserti]|uniref:Phosphotriesterase-related protein n=1 Tax=Amycolatopsis deserti TaxID=185696 RepID=A0ABQ3IDD3_9PSEU|nr:aryldialkylphosphatase [Amycolatopsis deserti]GHE79252.1 phosphotriesterase-related protein [Amycolatopsis deserti]